MGNYLVANRCDWLVCFCVLIWTLDPTKAYVDIWYKQVAVIRGATATSLAKCLLRYYRRNLLFDYWESPPNVFSRRQAVET